MNSAQRHFINWSPAGVWSAVILILSFIPSGNIPDISITHIDKAVHFLEFFIFSVLIATAIRRDFDAMGLYRALLFTLILTAVYGIVIELIQGFIPGRSASIMDVIADISGAFSGFLIKKRGFSA